MYYTKQIWVVGPTESLSLLMRNQTQNMEIYVRYIQSLITNTATGQPESRKQDFKKDLRGRLKSSYFFLSETQFRRERGVNACFR